MAVIDIVGILIFHYYLIKFVSFNIYLTKIEHLNLPIKFTMVHFTIINPRVFLCFCIMLHDYNKQSAAMQPTIKLRLQFQKAVWTHSPTLSESKVLAKPDNKENMKEESTPIAWCELAQTIIHYYQDWTARFYSLNVTVCACTQVLLSVRIFLHTICQRQRY